MEQQIMVAEKTQEAVQLHADVMASAKAANTALQEYCHNLKKMRDSKLYIQLGYADFGEYAEKAVGIKQRQAYNYIKMYEDLPAQLLEENAGLGVTKLLLLAQVTPTERTEFAEENDLAALSVEQVKALIAEKNGLSEQISLLKNNEDVAKTEKETAEKRAEELQEELEALKAAPPEEVTSAAVMPADIEEIKSKAAAEAVKQARAEAEKEKKEAVRKAKEDAEKAAEKKIQKAAEQAAEKAQKQAEEQAAQKLEEEKQKAAAAQEKAAALAKQMQVQQDTDSVKFLLLFDQLQATAAAMHAITEEMREKGNAEQADKLESALQKALEQMAQSEA